jgi:hypothetical protein
VDFEINKRARVSSGAASQERKKKKACGKEAHAARRNHQSVRRVAAAAARIKASEAEAAAFSLVPNSIMAAAAAGGRLFQWGDYAVFGLMLAVSAAIGLYHGLRRRRSGADSAAEFLTGGGQLGTVPVALSMLARLALDSNSSFKFPYQILLLASFGL